jgi:hypothetical protein
MTTTPHTPPPSADDVLMGGGSAPPRAEWAGPGARVEGLIVGKPRTYHSREFAPDGKGPLKYFPSGDPIWAVMVDVQTNMRGPDDNGIRRLYVESMRMTSAVRDAVRVAGASGLEPGAWLSVTLTGTEAGVGSIPANTWAAEYRRPNAAPTPVPNAPSAPATPLQRQQQAAAARGYAPEWQQAHTVTYGQPAGEVTYGTPAQTFAPPVPVSHYAPTPPPAMPMPEPVAAPPARVITETLAAAMRNAGVDVSSFTIVPG